jgi:hypothetical protein
MPRTALALAGLAAVLAGGTAEAAVAALKPLPALNGVRCRHVLGSGALSGYSCGRASDARSYVVTIEVSDASPYGSRPEDVRAGTWVRVTRTGFAGHVYVMVVATRTDGNVKRARREAAAAAKALARRNAGAV